MTQDKKNKIFSTSNFEYLAFEAFKSSGYFIINKILVKKFGLIDAGILANYIDKYQYFKKKESKFNGWFFYTHENVIKEILVTEYAIRRAKAIFLKLKIINTKMKGVPAKEWIRIDFVQLIKIMHSSALMDSPGLALMDSLGHLIIPNNNKKNILKKDKRPPIIERNKVYMIQARMLSKIIKKSKKIKHTISQLRGWTNPIRQMVEQNKISVKRIDVALKWYAKNCRKPYVPIIESGYALRMKFEKLEAAISRLSPTTSGKKSPYKIIKKRMDKSVVSRMKEVLHDIVNLIPDVDKVLLAESLCTLHDYIVRVRPKDAMSRTDHSEDIGSPVYLIEEFVYWMDNQSWLDNIPLSAFNSESKIWKRFLKYQEEKIGLNPMTGSY